MLQWQLSFAYLLKPATKLNKHYGHLIARMRAKDLSGERHCSTTTSVGRLDVS